jgi:hypothetical protein
MEALLTGTRRKSIVGRKTKARTDNRENLIHLRESGSKLPNVAPCDTPPDFDFAHPSSDFRSICSFQRTTVQAMMIGNWLGSGSNKRNKS